MEITTTTSESFETVSFTHNRQNLPNMIVAEASTPTGESSAAAVFQRLHPDQYLNRFLDKGYRPDGRRIDAWRDVSINVGKYSVLLSRLCLLLGSIATADGSALVRMGDTTMVCGVKAEIAEPTGSSPNAGFVGEWACDGVAIVVL